MLSKDNNSCIVENCLCYLEFGKYVLKLEIESALQELIPEAFSAYFTTDESRCVGTLRVRQLTDQTCQECANGWSHVQKGLRHLAMYSDHGEMLFSLEYDHSFRVIEVQIRKDNAKSFSLGIQHAMLITLSDQCVGLHGVTLICGDKVIVLSAPSGTGKTTLANLLRKYCEAAVINGDFALISVEDGQVLFEPTPFCGTSRRCLKYRLPLSHVVFLKQSPDNVLCSMNTREALINLLSNAFVPTWDESLFAAIQKTLFSAQELIAASVFSFAPNQEAAEMLQRMVNK